MNEIVCSLLELEKMAYCRQYVIFFYYDLDCNGGSSGDIADAIYELRLDCKWIYSILLACDDRFEDYKDD